MRRRWGQRRGEQRDREAGGRAEGAGSASHPAPPRMSRASAARRAARRWPCETRSTTQSTGPEKRGAVR
eukprot:1502908-Pleurochrysis_carterae.AAC.3